MRAFVAVADHGHFGRAARSLFLTQQALSKRVARLEEQVGTLFDRGQTGASLTERGSRFLPAAQQLLEAANHALTTALGESTSGLRVDVWGPVDPPESMVRSFAVEHPEAAVEISMRGNLPAALDALRRNEVDAALGNVANLEAPLGADLSAQLVAVSELAGLISDSGGLATAEVITWDALRRHGLALPDQASRPEFGRFVAEFAEAVNAPLSTETRSANLDRLVERVASDENTVTLVPEGWTPPEGAGVRVVPIHPPPIFPWFIVWRTSSPQPLVGRLVRTLRQGAQAGPMSDEGWLPATVRDVKDLLKSFHNTPHDELDANQVLEQPE